MEIDDEHILLIVQDITIANIKRLLKTRKNKQTNKIENSEQIFE